MRNLSAFILLPLLIVVVQAQIPWFGGCAEYTPMAGFSRDKFMGTWYEQEKYFTFSEVAARCVSATYERRVDGKLYVSNSLINRFTSVKRLIAGEIKPPQKRTPGTMNVRYSGALNYETVLNVLETDYKTYAVIWSCNRITPIGHADSYWVMTRDRIPSGPTMQRAYGVLDKFKIARTFFIKTDQVSCETEAPQPEAIDPTTDNPQPARPVQDSVALDEVVGLDGVTEAADDLLENEITTTLNPDDIGPDDELILVGGSDLSPDNPDYPYNQTVILGEAPPDHDTFYRNSVVDLKNDLSKKEEKNNIDEPSPKIILHKDQV